MLLRMMRFVAVIGLMLIVSGVASGQVDGWKMVHGDVLQVYVDQHKILLDCSGEQSIYVLEEDCQILRLGAPTSLGSMRPITPEAFQDALCWVNERGQISHILVSYMVREEDGIPVAYDIFGNLK
ncbi:MAG TPA: hypothetical protein VJZ70_05490 [Limnochordia bacterium]|nr:hypothetical protein [Limnochordia bacterium]